MESMISLTPWSMLAIILQILAHVQTPNVHDWLHVKACWSYAAPARLLHIKIFNHFLAQIAHKLQLQF